MVLFTFMARCFICSKGNVTGYQVSHSAIKTKRVFKPNLHVLRCVYPDKSVVRTPICSKCYKKMRNEYEKGSELLITPVSFLNKQKFTKTA